MTDYRFIDSHVNLHAPQFAEDQAEVIDRARVAGVDLMVNICDRVSNFDTVYKVAAQDRLADARIDTRDSLYIVYTGPFKGAAAAERRRQEAISAGFTGAILVHDD